MTLRLRAGTVTAIVLSLGLTLGACSKTTGEFELDPSYWFPDNKKKLPGDRREVFPGGVPGVTQGVPAELIKGSPQQQAEQAGDAGQQAPQQSEPAPAPKQAAKPRPKKVVRTAPPPADASEAPQPAPSAQRQAQPAGAWSAPQGGQQPQQPSAPANSAWPAPPGPGTFTR